jgi:hypothetical protein
MEVSLSQTDEKRAAREAFHVAKLALFNVRLLWDLQQASQSSCDLTKLIEERARQDHIELPVSLMHQSTFMQLGYVCIVWLWEVSKAEECADQILAEAAGRFNFQSAIDSKSGERRIDTPASVVRLVRNAISHARVSTDGEHFTFSDQGRNEQAQTTVRLAWSEFAQLSEAILFSVNSWLYADSIGANA